MAIHESGRKIKRSHDQFVDKPTFVDCSGGDVTDEVIFTETGSIARIFIGKRISGASLTVKNTAGTTLTKSMVDRQGTIPILLRNVTGCKITTSGFTGGYLTVYWEAT